MRRRRADDAQATVTVDAVIMIAVAVFSVFVAVRYIAVFRGAGDKPVFYQEMFGPAVMEACGRGFINPATGAVRALDEFLSQDANVVDCRVLPQTVAATALTPMQDVHRYLLAAAAVCWRVLGVRWSALDWLSAALFAFTAVTFYAACRLVAGSVLSGLMTVLAIISPLQLANLPHIRDYSKAPFFVVSAAGLAWLMTPRSPRWIYVGASVVAALIGLGIGFRTDVMLYLIPFVAGLLVCMPEDTASPWRTRLGACALCLAVCFAVSWPILRVYSSSGTLSHVALLGLTTPFDSDLGIRRSLYDFGDQYRDAYVNTVATSYWMRLHHAPVSDPMMYATASADYYRRLFHTFPADFVTRAWAAVLKCLNLPVDLNIATVVPSGITSGWLRNLYWWRWWLVSWSDGLAMPALVVLGMFLATRRRLAATFLIGFVALSAGVASLQFQPRHYFHVELLVYWIFAAAGAGLARVMSQWRHRSVGESVRAHGWRPLIFAISLFTCVVLPLAILRAYQSRSVSALLTTYDSAPTTPVEIEEHTSHGVAHVDVVSLHAASGTASVQMLVTTLDTATCTAPIDLTFRYTGDPNGQRDFTRSIHVDLPGVVGKTTRVLFPAYFVSSLHTGDISFVGVEVPEIHRHCVRSIGRFSEPDVFPVLLTTMLPGDWRTRPLYQRIDPVEIHPSMITPFVGKGWYRMRTLLHL